MSTVRFINPAFFSRLRKFVETKPSATQQRRFELILALALCATVDPTYGDAPMGLDSDGDIDGIFVSGVFSRTAMMVVLAPFQDLIPQQFSSYRLAPVGQEAWADAKLLYPKTTFPTDTELVGLTRRCSRHLTAAHEAYAYQLHAKVDP